MYVLQFEFHPLFVHLQDTYSRIAENQYSIPDSLSATAASLIRLLLHPHPRGRPTLRAILQDAFFTSGYFPSSLPGSCCTSPPVFPPPHHQHQFISNSSLQQHYTHHHHNSHQPPSNNILHQNSNSMHQNNNNVFQSADNIAKLTSSVHNLALPDAAAATTVVVPSPANSPMIMSPLPPASGPTPTSSFRGGSLADLTAAAVGSHHQTSSSPFSLSKSTTSATTRSLLPPPQQQHHLQQHTVVGLLGGPLMKPPLRAVSLHEALVATLAAMPRSSADPSLVPTTKDCPVFITKWIDYSNKYGFGFQLSDKSVGVLFNDNTRISFSFDRR
jgi:hypothetical protein